MRERLNRTGLYFFSIIMAACLAAGGCEEKDVFTVSQEEEIKRWVTDSDDGTELFGPLSFDSLWYFDLSDNDTAYTAILVSTSRSLSAQTAGPRDFGIGSYYYGYATVLDRAVGILRKQVSGRTLETEFRWNIERVGLFVKLGDSNQPFSGWLLCGFYGGPEVSSFDVSTSGGETLDNHGGGVVVGGGTYIDPTYSFMDIDDVESITRGSQIIFEGCPGCVIHVNYESPSGSATVDLTEEQADSLCFCDTLQTSLTTDRFWNLLYVMSTCMSGDSTLTVDHSFIPFKLSQ